MGKINFSRVLLGGVVAGIVSDILGFLADGLLLAPRWADGMKALGKAPFESVSQIVWFQVLGLLSGIFAVWLYAAIRPRYGAGPRTAILAGLAVWFIGTLLPNYGFLVVSGLFSKHLALYTTGLAIFEIVIGTVAGAALYQESAT